MPRPLYNLALATLLAMGTHTMQAHHAIAAELIDDTPAQALQVGGTVTLLTTAADLSAPDNPGWRQAQEYRIDLGLAPPVHPSVNLRHDATVAPVPVHLRAATDGKRLYLRLRWRDGSENSASTRSQFADGAAVQFALDAGPQTSFMMGAPNGAVNIWYWRAGSDQPENLAAGGFGSTTSLARGELQADSRYSDQGEWAVVFSRPLASDGEHEVRLEDGTASVALAVWQGEEGQRDGLKYVTMGWISLQQPQEQTAETAEQRRPAS